MTEEFLYYIWQYRLFYLNSTLVSGSSFSVIHPGWKNSDSGPDFFNAKIKIGDTLWAGNVEIHLNASDWHKHKHELDKNYDNVILHVVWYNDQDVYRHDGELMPTLELDGKIYQESWKKYLQFMSEKSWIPCQKNLHEISHLVTTSWLDTLLIERFERKAIAVYQILEQYNNDWNQAFFYLLSLNMGFKINNAAFAQLASSLPFAYMLKHADNLRQVEAILFGQAGMLEKEFTEPYPNSLKEEYNFLRKKFSLTPINGLVWKFMRLHPANFPTIRIAQFASLLHQTSGLSSKILDAKDIPSLSELLSVKTSEYWETHYVFDKPSVYLPKKLGKSAITILLINLAAPFLFVYGRQTFNNELTDKAIELLENLPSENNSIIKKWMDNGIIAQSAAQSQALLELKNNYCNLKKCLSCRFGNTLLKRTFADRNN